MKSCGVQVWSKSWAFSKVECSCIMTDKVSFTWQRISVLCKDQVHRCKASYDHGIGFF
jgi:hypothetical protein